MNNGHSPVGNSSSEVGNCERNSTLKNSLLLLKVMDGWMDQWIWIGGWMDAWMDGWLGGCMDARMHGWMGGWMDEWMGRNLTMPSPPCSAYSMAKTLSAKSQFWPIPWSSKGKRKRGTKALCSHTFRALMLKGQNLKFLGRKNHPLLFLSTRLSQMRKEWQRMLRI